jgi:formylglycine-generating enzyme required for sulfatase activity/serine/threonine protein kinase
MTTPSPQKRTGLDKIAASILAPPEQPDEIGRLGVYRVLSVLGKGGMGMVFRAEDPALRRLVALKIMLPELAKRGSAKDRFLREARLAATLEHDHVVTIHQVGEDRGIPFIAMSFLKGMSLDDWLKQKRPLAMPQILRIGRETAKGLAAAHDRGLIHRDIKPANLWLDGSARGRVKILDFGLARAEKEDVALTRSGQIIGTPQYMSPEQAGGDKLDARSDLFSLGVVLYRMCTGTQPFRGENVMALLTALAVHEPPSAISLNPETPPAFSDLIDRLLRKKPAERVGTAKEVVEAIAKIERDRALQKLGAAPTETSVAPATDAARIAASQAFNFEDSTDSLLSDEELAAPRKTKEPAAANRQVAWLWPAIFGGIAALGLGVAAIPIALLSGRTNGVEVARDKDQPRLVIDKKTAPPDGRDAKVPAKDGNKDKPVLPEPEPAIAPFGAALAAKHQKAWAEYAKQPVVAKSPIGVEMVLIPPGGGKMTQPWRLGKFEVTQAQFTHVMGWNPSYCQRENALGADPKTLPVENVRWYVAAEFCNELSKLEKLKPYYEIKVDKREGEEIVEAEVKILGGDGYRLPTEREWEYACRAGSDSAFGYSDRGEDLDKYGWYEKNSGGRSHKVGEKLPNGFGLHDMHGNANEWCWDLDRPGALARGSRGGGWLSPGGACSVGTRHEFPPAHRNNLFGMRLAQGPSQAQSNNKQVGAIPLQPKKKDEPPAVVVPESAIAPFDAALAAKHQKAWADYVKEPVVNKSRIGVEMVLIPPGGGKLSQPWRLAKFEVTQAQFTHVMGWNPSYCQGENAKRADPKTLPVESIRWYVAVEFCNELSKLESLKPYYEIKDDRREKEEIVEAEVKILGGDGYRLPTDREWDYACRAGSDARFGFSDREEDLDKYGWYKKNSDGRSHKVGEKMPNGFGLYDMYGNANEWCWDSNEPVSVARAIRGGGWASTSDLCSIGFRHPIHPAQRYRDRGMRLARSPSHIQQQ